MMRPGLRAVACMVLTDRPGGRTRIRGNAMPRRPERVITKRTVDALSVEHRDAVFWDRDLPGFGIRVYPSGLKKYVVQSRGPGGSKRATLGRHGKLTADEARRRAAEAIDRIKRGEDTIPLRRSPSRRWPFSPSATCATTCPRTAGRRARRSTGGRSTTTSCRRWVRCVLARSGASRWRNCITRCAARPMRRTGC